MPDISKINALAIGSVAKVDGLAKASILDIDGVAVPSAVGAPAAAYSVRLLGSAVGISSYTGDCMRVRRASDNVEADIAFDAGELKLTSGVSNTSDGLSYTDFADFVDHTGTPTDAFCRTWYDQSGNANDAGQSTAGSQPQIYDATTGLIEEGSVGNEKPALDFDGSNDTLRCASAFSEVNYISAVYVNDETQTYRTILGADSSNSTPFGSFYFQSSSATTRVINFARKSLTTPATDYEAVKSTAVTLGDQILHTGYFSGSTIAVAQNGSVTTSTIDTNDLLTIGGTQNGAAQIGAGYFSNNVVDFAKSNIQEIIVYDSDQSSNRTGIETDINGYFSIF